MATLQSAIYVAEQLLQNKAILLPRVCANFLKVYSSLTKSNDQPYLNVEETTIKFSARWLLQKLVMHLKQHLSFKCIHKKYGTLLYRTGGDVLSWALGAKSSEPECSYTVHSKSDESILIEASYIINDVIHNEIDRLQNMDCEPLNLDISKFTEDIDPKLLTFINNATKSTRCRKGAVSKVETCHTKAVRRFQIFCQLIFCTNPSCPTPMHYLLADAIEILCGGSRDLIKNFE